MKENIRVLIVEDVKHYQTVFEDIINSLEYYSELAPDLVTALEKLDLVNFHVALVDLRLNDQEKDNWDGFKVLERMKKLHEGTEVLVMTAYGEVEHASDAFRNYQVFDFIRKSKFDVMEVTDKIQAASEKALMEMRRAERRLDDQKIIGLLKVQPDKLIQQILQKTNLDYLQMIRLSEQMMLFLKRMLSDLAPLLPAERGAKVRKLSNGSVTIQIRFWSKVLGAPVETWFGKLKDMKAAIKSLEDNQEVMKSESYVKRTNVVLDSSAFPDFGGAIYTLANVPFSEFIEEK
jgi:CheY-like chemotaxis protein